MKQEYDSKKNPFSYKAANKQSVDPDGNAGLVIWLVIVAIVILASIN